MARIFRPVAQTSEAHVRYQHGTNLCENIFAFKWNNSTPLTEAELLQLATDVAGTIAIRMAALMHNGVIFREVYARNVDTEVANQATYTWTTALTGTRSGGPHASNGSAWVVKRTGLTGRSKHGGFNFSEFVEGDLDGNTIQSYLIGAIGQLIISIMVQRLGGRAIPALASRKLAASSLLRTCVLKDSDVDSCKSRLNRHGD